MFGNRKMYKRGLEDAMHAYEGFSEKQRAALEQLRKDVSSGNKKIEDALTGLGEDLNGIYQYLDSREKAALYHLETPMDIKDLDKSEQQLLVAVLYQLADEEGTRITANQRAFIRSVQRYLEITNPQTNIDLSVVGDIDSLDVQKAFLRISLEFFYLQEEEEITEGQEEFLSNFSVNKKQATAIENSVSRLYNAVGVEGITEKYGYVPEEPEAVIVFEENDMQSTASDDAGMDYEDNLNSDNLEDLMLDGTLHIKEGEKVVYRNKNIHFQAKILCEGELLFESCTIHYGENNSTGGIGIVRGSSLVMQQCTIKAHSYGESSWFISDGKYAEEILEEEGATTYDIWRITNPMLVGDYFGSKSISIKFLQCKFKSCVCFLQTQERILMDHCYIEDPCGFVALGGDKNVIRDCKFLLKEEPVFWPESIAGIVSEDVFAIDAFGIHIINSYVEGDFQMSSIDDWIRENRKEERRSVTFLQAYDGLLEKSSFKGIRRVIKAESQGLTAQQCIFEECYDVFSDGEFQVEECRFDRCSKIGNLVKYSTKFSRCQFNDCFCELIRNHQDSGRMEINCCEFNNWSAISGKRDNDSGMLILNGLKDELNEVTNCTFNGIQAYQYFLIRSYNNKSISNGVRTKVKHCTFFNCKTERKDNELINKYVRYTGLLNRTVSYKITDIDDCQGLEQVNTSDGHNDNVVIKDKSSSGEPIGVSEDVKLR